MVSDIQIQKILTVCGLNILGGRLNSLEELVAF